MNQKTIYRIRLVYALFFSFRFIFHFLIYLKYKSIVDSDLARCDSGGKSLFYQLTFHKDFRNLFYKRIGWWGIILRILVPQQKDLSFNYNMPLGYGCKLEHAHTTHLSAKSIGNNFTCFHLVTVGDSCYGEKSKHGTPVIGNNVTLFCNSSVLGDITIGNNVIVAAGAVVVNSVPDNCIVGGGTCQNYKGTSTFRN